MKRLLPLFFALLASMPAQSAEVTADSLLGQVRHATTVQREQTINGQLRKNKVKIPFGIQLKNGNIMFNYSEDGSIWKTFELRFKQKGQELYTYENGKATKFTTKRYHETIQGTDITFEDLSLRFLYWPNGKIWPDSHADFHKGRKCYIVEIKNPTPGSGAYAFVRVWIDRETKGLLKIHAFDGKGGSYPNKTFSINEFKQNDDKSWFFKQMRIEVCNPQTGKASAVNYIELN